MIPLQPWLQHLETHLPIAKVGTDPEGVHQVRVAVRRLRVWLELAGMRVLEDDLAWLVRGAGKVRDLEVLLGQPGLPQPFREWGLEQLGAARLELVPLLESPRLKGLLRALALLPPLEETTAKARLPRFGERAAQRAREWEQQGTFETLHALRRALRKLRYAREWLGLSTEGVKKLQEALGAVGDLTFILHYLTLFEAGSTAALPRFRRQLEAGLEKALNSAQAAWEAHRGQALG
ncbi:CHAD domain-containing protein [Meiothermus granaticius]|uniref:CHAD domain protein n=1 Tax=Meiothermus granaticius NBRC 107808 TaxID=1227551 RepID=A0A399F6J2_9DEIN|nr:CHAD domain-containing protein [Meiothermus granaticius]RIH92357.1 CHAD domain protein [Meiothermus granaticius NBRC 107808]GEM87099.1 hypothetical protein MGR01S_17240 [Meiothermus granaticius NBRC 107808]